MNDDSFLANEVNQMAGMRTADEMTRGSACLEGFSQGQTAYDVAAADLQGGVSTEGDKHNQLYLTHHTSP